MNIKLVTSTPSEIETECLVVAVVDAAEKSENGANDKPNPKLLTDDPATLAAAADLIASGEVSGKALETTLLHKPAGLKAKRLLLIGGGKAKSFSTSELRKIAGAAVRTIKGKDLTSFALAAPTAVNFSTEDAVKSIVEGAYVGSFDPDYYKSDRKEQKIDELVVIAPVGSDAKSLQAAIEIGTIIGEAQNFTRDLVNEPGNRMTPTILADRAKKMSDEVGLQCEVYGPDKIKELKMGAFWSVAQGSPEEPPRLIVMRHEPSGAPEKPVLGLVGKGVTFDSGGISIKPSEGMEKMKYDMAGGASMLGVMRALAALKPSVKVICVVPATENMPGGKAQKPGDIQTAMSGKTIEVLNTDAEGRLILADGIHYAKQLGATQLVDAATLTGAIVVALAGINVGVFGSDQAWTDKLLASAKVAGEKMWPMPMDEEYREFIKGSFADIQNISSSKGGGAITGAMFIREFAGDTPWIHLDIAGTAWNDDSKPWLAKGPTGVTLRTLVHLITSL